MKTRPQCDASVAQAQELACLLPVGEIPRLLLQASGVAEETLDALVRDGSLEPADESGLLRWTNPETPGQIKQGMTPATRQTRSLALAEAARDLRLAPAQVAAFFEEAQRLDSARDFWLKAAEKACVAGDYANAMSWLERALRLWPWTHKPTDRVRALKEAARCATNAGMREQADAAWRELADYAADTRRPALEVEALGQLAACATDIAQIGHCLRRAADLATEALPPAESVPVLLDYVDHLATRARISAASQTLEKAALLVEDGAEPGLLSVVRGWQGLVAAMAGNHDEARELVEQSLRIALDHDLKEQVALAYRRRGNICEYRGDYEGQTRSHQQAILYCQTNGASGETTCLSCLAYACFRVGDWREAVTGSRQVLQNPGVHPALQAIANCVLGMIAAFRGERAPARKRLHLALDRLRVDGLAGLEMFCLWALAHSHEMDGDVAAAAGCYDEIRALWRETEDIHDVVPGLLFAGSHYADTGRPDALADCLDILGSVERRNPIPEARAALALLRAERAALDGDMSRVENELSVAAKRLHEADLPLELLWVEFRRTRLLPAAAASREAEQLAARLGMRPLLARLREPATASAAPGDLTGRQADVLRGLARGLTSKEIAHELSLSTRTVEMHVARLLDRLDCRTRTEAVKIAAQKGWV